MLDGAISHCLVDHLVANLSEVLKCHLRQKCYALVQTSAKDPVLLSYISDATSLKCHVQLALQCLKNLGSQREGLD